MINSQLLDVSAELNRSAKSAVNWLINKANTQNPVPYPLFKTAVLKNAEWARTQRGIILDVDKLYSAAISLLLSKGWRVQQNNELEELDIPNNDEGVDFSLELNLTSNPQLALADLFCWASNVFSSTLNSQKIIFSAKAL